LPFVSGTKIKVRKMAAKQTAEYSQNAPLSPTLRQSIGKVFNTMNISRFVMPTVNPLKIDLNSTKRVWK
jgi:hypothetical protein